MPHFLIYGIFKFISTLFVVVLWCLHQDLAEASTFQDSKGPAEQVPLIFIFGHCGTAEASANQRVVE